MGRSFSKFAGGTLLQSGRLRIANYDALGSGQFAC